MKIGFDLRPFLRKETGVGTYLKNLLFHLAQVDPTNEYFLFSASWKDRFREEKIPPLARKKIKDWRLPVKVLNFFWYRWPWPRLDWFFGTKLDLTHSATPLPLPSGGKKIVTIHDLHFFDFPQEAGGEAGKFFFRRLPRVLQQVDGIITSSAWMRDEIVARFGVDRTRLRVIPPGFEPSFGQEIPAEKLAEARQKFRLPPTFLLFVGAQEPRKNLLRLLDALAILHRSGRKIPLVVVGPEGKDSKLFQRRMRELDLSVWVRQIGYLDHSELRAVYRLASAFVFPSLFSNLQLRKPKSVESSLTGRPILLWDLCRWRFLNQETPAVRLPIRIQTKREIFFYR